MEKNMSCVFVCSVIKKPAFTGGCQSFIINRKKCVLDKSKDYFVEVWEVLPPKTPRGVEE